MLSGGLTSLLVILIVIFLFREGIGVFGSPSIPSSSVLAVNSTNPVKKLTAAQVKLIFDQEITNWKELGGKNDTIILFYLDNITDYYSEEQIGKNFENLPACINNLVDSLPNVVAFFPEKYKAANFKGSVVEAEKIKAGTFLGGKEWYPTAEPAAQMGVLPLILGTLLVSFLAIIIALPLGLATAIYMGEIANDRIRRVMKPIIELLAGIPSVVYGFFGLVVIVPLIKDVFGLDVGETALSGSIILAIMALPTIITISEDAIRNTPRAMKEASLALGATQWQTIYKVVIPYSASGITAAAILGIGRAVGETMAVLMVTGNASVIPHSILQPVRTIPATIAAELGEAPQGGLHYKALFALGCILFLITLIINLSVESISKKKKAQRH
ncbi:MAG: phosphate ABC transporter permease subunit PstC [Bacteroidota bacterium]|nr:phosphate ABC transporter permease subunit PstC [Bacteroidota bacterium]